MEKSTQLSNFNYYLRIERKMSPNTVASYCSDVSDFSSFCSGNPARATSEDVTEYLKARSEELSKRSQARVLSSLRSFFDWTVLEGLRPMGEDYIAKLKEARDSRWISSIKRISPWFRLVRMLAKSPGRSMAGPEVTRMFWPISAATMQARVVFPRPGGP